ncbi:MAG: hypothetical protein FWD22_00840 [Treponema sp.]|nr:hypothetical protein [Treponema sp.]
MKSKYLIFTILLIVIGCGSLFFGLISCQSVNTQTAQDAKDPLSAQSGAQALLSRPRGPVSSFLVPEAVSEKGIQGALSGKSRQILDIWAVLKTMNGVINVLQSAQVRGNFFIESSVNPMEFLAPVDSVLNKVSDMLLWAYSAVTFEKILLSTFGLLAFILLIPLCILIAIVTLWTCKDKAKIHKIVIVTLLISFVIPLAIPASIHASSFLGDKIFAKNVNTLVASIEEKGKIAKTMEDDILRTRRTGNSIINFMPRARDLGNDIIGDVINYFIIFLFINIIIPILVMVIIFFLVRFTARIILNK